MSSSDTHAPETFEYRAEMKQLLHLIVHSLYTHEEIFLRELISNASDALNKVRFRLLTDRDIVDPDAEQSIDIRLNKDENTLSITDTGIGMTKEDLIGRIGTVASSGTLAFLEEIKKKDGPVDAHLIGQFGVGFYAAFMVADRIVIETRAADADSVGLRWESDGGGSYTIDESDRTERGTTITLHLKEDKGEFADAYRVKQIIRKYSNFVAFPILVEEEKVNTVQALWHRPKGEVTPEELNEFYKFVSNDYDEPLGHLQLSIEGMVSFRALLFIPKKAPRGMFREDFEHGLHLYSNKVFIQDDCTSLLPEYMRFIRGVVDTADLPLNVSREVTQHSPVMAKIRKTLVSKMLGMLAEWAADDHERFKTFTKEFGPLFKSGLSSDFDHRDELTELIRFESTATEKGEFTSLSAYFDRMKEGQEAIYYVLGDSRATAERNPNLEYFRANDIEVLLMTEAVDSFIVPGIPNYKEKELTSVEKADLKLDKKDTQKNALPKKEAKKLVDHIKTVLGDRVEDVRPSERLVNSAATLVTGAAGMDAQMERMMRMMDENFQGGKKVLEINTQHPLIKNLSALRSMADQEALVDMAIEQLFAGAQLLEGSLDSPQDLVANMTEMMVRATKSTD